MVEVSDMSLALELMSNRKLRPPLPLGIPPGTVLHYFSLCAFTLLLLLLLLVLLALITACWSEVEGDRPTFGDVSFI